MARDARSGAVLIDVDQSAAAASKRAREKFHKDEERLTMLEERVADLESQLNLYKKLK